MSYVLFKLLNFNREWKSPYLSKKKNEKPSRTPKGCDLRAPLFGKPWARLNLLIKFNEFGKCLPTLGNSLTHKTILLNFVCNRVVVQKWLMYVFVNDANVEKL